MRSLAQETLRYLAAGRIQWEKDHYVFALSFPKPLLVLAVFRALGWVVLWVRYQTYALTVLAIFL